MKLLAVFGLALAVVAMVVPGGLKSLKRSPLFSLCEAVPDNRRLCSEVLSVVCKNKISLTGHPQVAPLLLRHCLETGTPLLPEIFLEMDVVHVAALIFMFRVQGYEKAAERLYNFIVKERFPAEFKAELHKEPYPQNPLQVFNGLTEEHDKQFFALWTVQMYDKRQEHESEDAYRERLLMDSEDVTKALVTMGIPLGLQLRRMVLLPRKLPAGTALDSLSGFKLMLVSFTEKEYLELQKPEQIQLRAFLGRYLRFYWNNRIVPAERLSEQEFKQFTKAFTSEFSMRDEDFAPHDITHLAWYLYWHIQLRCPVFLLKGKFDSYSTATEGFLNRRHYLLMALTLAREIVEEMGCPDKGLVCLQIERAIKECNGEISEFCRVHPRAKEAWKNGPSGQLWATFKEESEKAACTGFRLMKKCWYL